MNSSDDTLHRPIPISHPMPTPGIFLPLLKVKFGSSAAAIEDDMARQKVRRESQESITESGILPRSRRRP